MDGKDATPVIDRLLHMALSFSFPLSNAASTSKIHPSPYFCDVGGEADIFIFFLFVKISVMTIITIINQRNQSVFHKLFLSA